jgi:hypothetical protein
MRDTNDLSHPTSPLTNIASEYLSAALDMLPCAAGVATLVLVACVIPTANAFDLATVPVFVGLTVYVGVEFLREVSNACGGGRSRKSRIGRV